MKTLTPAKLGCIVLLVFAGVFLTNTFRFRAFGRVVATKSVTIDSVPHRVLLRERAFSALDIYFLDRISHGRSSEYEYWTELRLNGNTVAVSNRFHQDSTTFDDPQIDSADSSAATVILDPQSPHPSDYRFRWVSNHASTSVSFDWDSDEH